MRSDATGETPGMMIYSSDRLVIVRITLFVGSIGMNMRWHHKKRQSGGNRT